MIKRVLECVRSFKEDSREKTMDIYMRDAILHRPGKAVGGGIHLSVDLSYQVAPNIHTKYVLYSKCKVHWIAI